MAISSRPAPSPATSSVTAAPAPAAQGAAPTGAHQGAQALEATPTGLFEADAMEATPATAAARADAQAAANARTITAFYKAFDAKDGAAMAAMYHPDATFEDPAFGVLKGKEVGAMWQMLAKSAPDLGVRASNVKATADAGSAHWDADYTFSLTGNQVHNSIDAQFTFKDGKIFTHKDTFDFQKWAGQALGLNKLGWLGRQIAGWGVVQHVMQRAARGRLEDYMAKKG